MKKNIIFLFALSILISCVSNEKAVESNSDNSPLEIKEDIVSCSFYIPKNIPPKVEISGTISSKNKVDLLSEVSGKLRTKKNNFKVGNEFKKGQTLIRVESSDLKLEIKSVKSEFLSLLIQCLPDLKLDYPASFNKWEAYVEGFNINRRLKNLPDSENNQIRNYLSGRGIYSLFYRIMSLENKLDKFSIKAPFDCVVTQSFLSTGSNIVMGQKIGQIIDKKNYEISTSLGISESELFKIGDYATLNSEDIDKTFSAKIKRKGNHINTLTQSIDIFFDISDKDLKDGMFVKGYVTGEVLKNVYKIPRNKLVKDKNIFIKKNNILEEKEIKVIYFDNDSVIISGLDNEDCVIDNYRNYFYDGMEIN